MMHRLTTPLNDRRLVGFAFLVVMVLVATALLGLRSANAECQGEPGYIEGGGGTCTDVDPVRPENPVHLTANPQSIASGQSSLLSWTWNGLPTGHAQCSIDNGIGAVGEGASSRTVYPTQTTTYTISCATSWGYGTGDSATVTIASTPAPTATITANPTSVTQGNSSTLSWSSANATSCTGTNFSTGGAISGSLTVTPGSTTNYSVSCTGSGGTANAFTSVTVISPLSGSCSVSPTSIATGDSATWSASASGGTGAYTYSWTGTDGLSGSAASVVGTYQTPGTKTASVTITSGSQAINTVSQNMLADSAGYRIHEAFGPVLMAHAQLGCGNPMFGCGGGGDGNLNNDEVTGGGGVGGGTPTSPGNPPSSSNPAPASITVQCSNSLSVGAAPFVDLTAGATSPSSGTAGTPVTFTAPATNGGTAASGAFPMLFEVQSVALVNSPYNGGLGAGATQSMSASYTFSSAGSYNVRACANYNTSWTAITTESNYGNNCGPWTAVSVAAAAPTGTLSCTVSSQNPARGTTVTYTATPANGATGPYTWNDTQGGSYGTAATASRLISGAGPYTMFVSGTNVASNPASCPAVGGASCGAGTATITATPNRVREGQTATISWSATGVDTSCVISGPGVSQTIPGNACTMPSGSATPTITAQSVYTITCDGGEAKAQAVVNLIPKFIEF